MLAGLSLSFIKEKGDHFNNSLVLVVCVSLMVISLTQVDTGFGLYNIFLIQRPQERLWLPCSKTIIQRSAGLKCRIWYYTGDVEGENTAACIRSLWVWFPIG